MLNTSLCITLRNETDSIADLWKSIEKQTKKPDEVVIVDAGSTDGTVRYLEKKFKTSKIKLRLIKEKKINRSKGRNIAIANAKNEIIALTDGGCTLDKNWLKEITAPFQEKFTMVVPGNYEIDNEKINSFGLVAAVLTYKRPKNETEDYLASSRSLALRKSAWKKVGGYPEKIDTAEDLVFAARLKKDANLKHVNAPKAIVYWKPQASLVKQVRTFWNYAIGDGVAGLASPHAGKYGLKLFVGGNILFWGTIEPKLLLLGLFGLIIWWIISAIKLNKGYTLLKQTGIFTIWLTVAILFWVTVGGFLWGIGKKYIYMRK